MGVGTVLQGTSEPQQQQVTQLAVAGYYTQSLNKRCFDAVYTLFTMCVCCR